MPLQLAPATGLPGSGAALQIPSLPASSGQLTRQASLKDDFKTPEMPLLGMALFSPNPQVGAGPAFFLLALLMTHVEGYMACI